MTAIDAFSRREKQGKSESERFENVSEKGKSGFLGLYRNYSNPLSLSSVSELFWH